MQRNENQTWIPLPIIRLTALFPPPPTPMTLIRAPSMLEPKALTKLLLQNLPSLAAISHICSCGFSPQNCVLEVLEAFHCVIVLRSSDGEEMLPRWWEWHGETEVVDEDDGHGLSPAIINSMPNFEMLSSAQLELFFLFLLSAALLRLEAANWTGWTGRMWTIAQDLCMWISCNGIQVWWEPNVLSECGETIARKNKEVGARELRLKRSARGPGRDGWPQRVTGEYEPGVSGGR